MILLCYDGSADARAAIDHAGTLFSGQAATVLTVWERFAEVMARASYGFGGYAGIENVGEIDAATEHAAQRQADAGAELARAAGLDASGRTCTRRGSVADGILQVADELDVTAIVAGSRGLTGLKSMMLGSVSHELIHHADRTVIVVPSAEIAVARREHLTTVRSRNPLPLGA
jgi:nucleotide-binding universal stress UspA family protein